jgi:predicted  nucleic acid-binding Zn-ribbon protein
VRIVTPEHASEIRALQSELDTLLDDIKRLTDELVGLVSDPGWYREALREREQMELRVEQIENRIYRINWLYEGV